jgi:hypothetical protein
MSTPTETIELDSHLVGALNNRRRPGETKTDVLRRVLEQTYNGTDVEEFLRECHSRGADFIVVPEEPISDGCLHLVVAPINDELVEYVEGIHGVVIDGDHFVTTVSAGDRITGDIHSHRRIPVTVPDNLDGIDPVNLDDGIEAVQTFIREDREPTPRGDATVELRTLVEDLVEAGANAVTISHEMWIVGDRIEPTAYMPSGDGYDVAGEYDTVTIDGDQYPLNCRFTLTGLDTHTEAPVYISDDWERTEPVTIDEGLGNVRDLLDADTHEDLRSNRESTF